MVNSIKHDPDIPSGVKAALKINSFKRGDVGGCKECLLARRLDGQQASILIEALWGNYGRA
jgi:hypothetical protein